MSTEALDVGVLQATSSTGIDIQAAKIRGMWDIDFFAMLCMPLVFKYKLPDFYKYVFALLSTREDADIGRIVRFALGLPRGHAKTTFIKILICWLIVYDKVSFAAIVCATDDMAENLLADVSNILGSPNMEAIFGAWEMNLTTDNKTQKIAYYHERIIILVAKGAGSALRGLNIDNKRPDLIFCDDAQTKECDESPTERVKFRKWLTAMFKIIAPEGNRLIIYVGNMYSDECILYQLKESPSWISLVTGAILATGEPLWPELHSLESLYDSYVHDESLGEADVWFAEVMNDPISRATSLILEQPPATPWEETMEPDAVFITIDPAGFKKVSDDNVIALHYVVEGKGAVAKLDVGIKDPEQLILAALSMALENGASLIGIEDVAYQSTLLFWIQKYIQHANIQGIEIVPLKPRNRTKEYRIRLFVAEVIAGNYYLYAEPRAVWVWQALKYKIGKKENKDDILDAVAYGLDVRAEYWHHLKNLRTTGRLAHSAGVVEDNTPF